MTDAQRAGKGMGPMQAVTQTESGQACNCIGPQWGEKYCPCQLRTRAAIAGIAMSEMDALRKEVATLAAKLRAGDALAAAVQTVMDVDGLFYSPTTAAMTKALAAYKQAGMGGEDGP